MNNEIIIKQNGFVTGNALLNPIAYAGEMNSRILSVTHPTFDNCHYQFIIVKNSYPYVVGITDGEVMLPPSLLNTATTLDCQFIAVRKNDNIDINANLCDCKFGSSDDCSNTVWKSDSFKLSVAQGLSLNGLNPIPPYEQLVDIYNNISKARLAVEKAKTENMQLLETINQKIDELQRLNSGNDNNNDTNTDGDDNDNDTNDGDNSTDIPTEPNPPDDSSDNDGEIPVIKF